MQSHYISDDEGSGEIVDVVKDGFDLSQSIKIDLPIDNVLVNNIVRGVGKFIPNAQVTIGFTVQDPRPYQLKMLKRAVTDADGPSGFAEVRLDYR